MSAFKRYIFSRGIIEDIDPNEPPIPIGNPVNFTTSIFQELVPTCGDSAVIYSSTTRLQQNVITWLNTRTTNVNVSHMNYTVYEGTNNIPQNGHYRFGSGRNIIRLLNGIVQDVQHCQPLTT